MSGENLNVIRDNQAASGSSDIPSDPFTRRVEDKRRVGRAGLPKARSRYYAYDRMEGMAKASLRFEVEKTDRSSPAQASNLLNKLHVAHGVANAMEGTLYDYDNALFLCYAFNGASQVGPMGRVHFYIFGKNGEASAFEYETVANMLGIEFRRFFRAYANDVVEACRSLYDHCDFEDSVQVEMRDMMIQLADKRNVSRFPWLIADCAEAATNLSPAEVTAVMMSKVAVIGSSTNAVDKRALAMPVRSLDNYDSSIGESVSGNNDIHARSDGYYK